MSSATRWVALAVATGVALLGSAAPGNAQTAGTAEVILARAPVELVAKGQTAAQPLQKGARLSEGDRIRTGKGGAAEVVLGDGSLVRVGELSDLEIDKLDVDAANQPTTSRFNLAAGQARAWVARQVVAKVGTGMGRFAVQSPTAVAAVRQTDFALANGRVYTFAGVVETRSTRSLHPRQSSCAGETGTRRRCKKPDAVQDHSAPRQARSCSRRTGSRWKAPTSSRTTSTEWRRGDREQLHLREDDRAPGRPSVPAAAPAGRTRRPRARLPRTST